MARNSRVSFVAAIALLLLSAGCQSRQPQGTEQVRPTYRPDGQLENVTFDRNADGRPDAWLFLEKGQPLRAELDENYDGKADRWEHYEPRTTALPPAGYSGPVPRGVLVRAEQDLRGDGKVSRWETYSAGVLTSVEEDASGDGRPDKWESWADGALVAIALDTQGRGRPDRRLVYDPTGASAPRLEVDDDGDGVFEAGPASE